MVKTDPCMRSIHSGYFKDAQWQYCTGGWKRGMHLICNNGYLGWPTSIMPYTLVSKSLLEGCFSANLESVRKDVECTFEILKKRWKILNNLSAMDGRDRPLKN